MKVIGLAAMLGGGLGAAVAVVAHFMSHTLPSTFVVVGVSDGRTGSQTLESPPVHPSWLPVLPVAIGVGLVAGAALGLAAHRLGLRVVRRSPEPTAP
jgi:hypothetical protein